MDQIIRRYDSIPAVNNASADWVLGQNDFTGGAAGLSQSRLDEPSHLWSDGTRIFVADADNNRIMIWNNFPGSNGANADHVLEDMNILLPIQRFHEDAAEGRIGGLAGHAYSFMGYQGFPADLTGWRQIYGPQVAERLRAEEVDCVFLTSA